MQHVGPFIRSRRTALGWTQSRLHLIAGVNLGDISRIERGRLTPTPEQLQRILKALGVTEPPTDIAQERIAG